MRWPILRVDGQHHLLLTILTWSLSASIVLGASSEPHDTSRENEIEHQPYQAISSANATKKPQWKGYLPRIKCGRAPLYDNLTSTSRIINGVQQRYGQFPSYVRLYVQTAAYSGLLCGGTLISDRHVLTAAHCVTVQPTRRVRSANSIRVFMGEHQVDRADPNERQTRASGVCVSPHYNHNMGQISHDWAVLTLERRVNFTDHIQPACLPRARVNTYGRDTLCWLVGAGATGFRPGGLFGQGEGIMPPVVRAMRTRQVKCRAWNIQDSDRSRVCYTQDGGGQGTSCQGDSGGPIFCRDRWGQWNVMGVVSAGTQNCSTQGGMYAIYANVRRLLRDIEFHCFKPRGGGSGPNSIRGGPK